MEEGNPLSDNRDRLLQDAPSALGLFSLPVLQNILQCYHFNSVRFAAAPAESGRQTEHLNQTHQNTGLRADLMARPVGLMLLVQLTREV